MNALNRTGAATAGWIARWMNGSRGANASRVGDAAWRAVLFGLLVLVVAVVGGCDRAAKSAAGKPRVVCTIGMIGDAAKFIGAEHVDVTVLMGQGVDPHLYKASPGDIRVLSEADLVLYNGLHLEGRMGDVLEKIGEKKPVKAVAATIDPALLRRPAEFEGQPDPHVWFDVSIWMSVVAGIRDSLVALDPVHAADYARRADEYLAQLKTLHQWCGEEIAKIPESRRVLITAHDAFGYFSDAYHIEVRAIQGVSTDSEAGIKSVNELVDFIVARQIPSVFVESSVPRKAIEALVEGCRSRGHTVAIGGELFSDAMGAEGTPEGTYIGMVKHNVNAIVSALGATDAAKTGAGAAAEGGQ